MAEIFLSATIEVLIEKLLSPDLINYFAHHEGVHTAVKKWEETLTTIWEVLDDAEKKQVTNRAVKRWLDKLRDLAYDVEDLLDEFATEALRRKLKAESQASTSRVRSLIPTHCSSLKPSAVMFNHRMGSKIKAITARLEEIVIQKKHELEVREIAGGMSNKTRERPVVIPTSSSAMESHVYGREKDKEAVLELLLRREASSGEVRVISIIGMGGIGKTTLARDVYNDDKVKGYFDIKAWVCVSDNEEVDFIQITKAMLESFGSTTSTANDLNQLPMLESKDSTTSTANDLNQLPMLESKDSTTSTANDLKQHPMQESFRSKTSTASDLDKLQLELKSNLSKIKFLLVLDDVWHENHDDWTTLCRPLKAGAPGSKIIVTTRSRRVSETMDADPYILNKLSDDECLSIFSQAAGKGDSDLNPEFRETGKAIVKRCNGLPLAAKTIGGLLRDKVNHKEWTDVLASQIWDFPESDIIPALRLSYHHLPPDLKQCFAYCSIFPKDFEFREEELVLLWMAAGLVHQQDESKQIEEIGHSYFHDLLSRSFFQLSSTDESQFVMHDLINDLAQWVAGETCFRLEGMKQYKVSKKARHSSYIDSGYDRVNKFEAFYEVEYLRTFLPLRTPAGMYSTHNFPLDLLPKLRCLRVLSLNGFHIAELPNSIGDMNHLRYLDLSYTKIRSLPETTCTLYNLQTLIVRDCSNLEKLPKNMMNLINLRHLDITNATLIKRMPTGVGKLISLRKLSHFLVGNDNGLAIRELMKLNSLHGTLCISGLENVIDDQDAIDANLKDKHDLKVLTLEWNSQVNGSRKDGVEVLLDMLRPHEKLKDLTIKCFKGTRFPTWLGDPSFSKLAVLRLEGCVNCTSLPPLGQLPMLEDLWIKGVNGVRSVGLEFYGVGCLKPFPRLKTLQFENMEKWEVWENRFRFGVDTQVEVFPKLRKLSIEACPKLSGKLPDHLPSLEKLIIHDCQQLAVSISTQKVFPSLCELSIKGCPKLSGKLPDHLPFLEKPAIYECQAVANSSLSKLSKLHIEDQPEVLNGSVGSRKSMILSYNSKQQLELTEGLTKGVLEIEGCTELTSLWGKELGLLQHLTYLCDHLKIKDCPKFVSLVAEVGEQQQQQQHQQGLPCRLESLELYSCEKLEKLQGLPSMLIELGIEDCDAPKSTSLPSSLIELRIEDCDAPKSIPREMTHFSDWTSLEYLRVESCESLASISRGQLPSTLKRLKIKNCKNMLSLLDNEEGSTSYLQTMQKSHNSSTSLLERLSISDCPSLTSLSSRGELPATVKRLSVVECPKLESVTERLHNNTSLEHIKIRHCESLKCLPDGLHDLTHLDVYECAKLGNLANSIYSLTSLLELSIDSCPGIVSFPDGGFTETKLSRLSIGNCKNLRSLPHCLYCLTSLQNLTIKGCSSFESFPDGGLPATKLSQLSIENCEKLRTLPDRLYDLTSLQELTIRRCPSIKSFPDGGLPATKLSQLLIEKCEKLRTLPDRLYYLTSLQELTIIGCPSIKSFPKEGFPTKLTSLHIWCPKIRDPLFEWRLHRLTSLQVLSIRSSCPNVVSFPEEKEKRRMMLPTSLTDLTIVDFQKLKHLSSEGFRKLTSLNDLSISDCPNLESFPQIHTSLRYLEMKECPKLKSFPKEGFQKLTSLEWLVIEKCPKLKSFLKEGFQKLTSLILLEISDCPSLESFPQIDTPLERLVIGKCPKLKSFPMEGFQKLTSLNHLEISDCPSLESFPQIHTSLEWLVIGKCPKLKFFPKEGFQKLTSLYRLWIFDCPSLKYFPEIHNSSLQYLDIFYCPNLKSFPKEGLPPSLVRLSIYGCPRLQQLCKKDQGRYWPQIAHIPDLWIPET